MYFRCVGSSSVKFRVFFPFSTRSGGSRAKFIFDTHVGHQGFGLLPGFGGTTLLKSLFVPCRHYNGVCRAYGSPSRRRNRGSR